MAAGRKARAKKTSATKKKGMRNLKVTDKSARSVKGGAMNLKYDYLKST